jgi:putative nucleotidyltransferase with HDIG domain
MWTFTKNKDWNYLTQTFSWVADMHGVPQDAVHHAEGDVAAHTQMVLAALQDNAYFKALPTQQQEVLWAAALLHDVEKRSTTKTESDGSITSRGHAKRGEVTAREILFTEVETPFHLREHIAALVRYHGLPLWLFEKADPQKAVIEASLRTDMQLLSLLARADVEGRICKDTKELLERIDFFDAYCMEQDCWNGPKAFASGAARFHYSHKEDATPDYVPYDDTTCEVILLSALPGMGKDCYIQQHYKDYPVISLDDIRRKHKLKPEDRSANGWIAQQAKEMAKQYLRTGQSFVWNATNITRQMRSQLIDLFTTYKAKVTIVYIERPYSIWLKQNSNREHAVPALVLHRMLQKLEVPLMQEAHEVIWYID